MSKDDYIKSFAILRDAGFKKRLQGNSFLFTFARGSLPIKYKDKRFAQHEVLIEIGRDKQNFAVYSIEVR